MRLLSKRAGTPLLVGPEGTEAEVGSNPAPTTNEVDSPPDDSAPSQSDEADPAPSRSTDEPRASQSVTSSESSDATQTTDGGMTASSDQSTNTDSPASSPLSTTSAASSATQPSTIDNGPPRIQLTSLAYLIPIFLLVVITVGVIIYRKCCRRRRTRKDIRSDGDVLSPGIPVASRPWQPVATSDYEAEKHAPWSPRSEEEEAIGQADEAWRSVSLKESKSRPGLMDVTYNRGWLDSAKWKPARAFRRNANDSTSDIGSPVGAPGQTMRLVLPRSGPTYQSLLPPMFRRDQTGVDGDGQAEGSNYGSRRSWNDFKAMAFRLTPSRKQLERNKSPNKRRSIHPPAPLPGAPEWILPRATSPDHQVLSPPLQPDLFFHPTPLASMPTLRLPSVTNTDSEGTYTDTDTQLGSSMVSSRARDRHADTNANKSSRATSGVSGSPDATPIQRWRQALPVLAEAPTTTGRGRDTAGYMVNGATGATSTSSPRRSRKERKEQKARQRVESILQASWSDRALSSPGPSTTDLSAPITATRAIGPDFERVDAKHGGIDARLAGLLSSGAQS